MTREEAIEDIKFAKYKLEEERVFPSLNEAFHMAIEALEQVPKWESEFVCETCGYEIPHLTKVVCDVVLMDSKDWNYCPNCGTKREVDTK